MKSFSAILPVVAAVIESIAMLIIAESSAMAVTYPPPFPNTVNSVFGPRHYAPSPFHKGIDYLQVAGKPIPAAAGGYVNEILDDGDKCGVRLYLVTDDNIELGYCHLFTKTTNLAYPSGGFTLLKKYAIPRSLPTDKLRANAITTRCNIVLVNNPTNNPAQRIALVPKRCAFPSGPFAVGRTMTYNKIVYTIANRVTANQLIAPVGNSGSAGDTGPHLHLNYGRGKDNPLQVIDHPNGSFCARLMDAGVSPSACDPVAAIPVIQQSNLNTNKYIDIRVDFTGRLDLDQATFNISTSPVQSFSLQYGGTNITNPLANGFFDLSSSIDINCNTVPFIGKVIICPTMLWEGQGTTSRLETKFRLGINAAAFTPGNYHVDVTLQSVTGVVTPKSLPFTVGGPTCATDPALPPWPPTDFQPAVRLKPCAQLIRGVPVSVQSILDIYNGSAFSAAIQISDSTSIVGGGVPKNGIHYWGACISGTYICSDWPSWDALTIEIPSTYSGNKTALPIAINFIVQRDSKDYGERCDIIDVNHPNGPYYCQHFIYISGPITVTN